MKILLSRFTALITVITLFNNCGKPVNLDDVLKPPLVLSSRKIDADGSTSVTITATLNSKASTDRRNIIFTSSAGNFDGGTDGKITVPADFVGGQLIATATLNGTLSPGKIIITAKPAVTSPNGDYQLTDSIVADKVDPATIKLWTSSFGIGSNYINTDTIIGTLKSALNTKVSLNAKVTFTDDIPAYPLQHGSFRSVQNTSDANSQVRALYSAPFLPIGTEIFIKATIDLNGASDIIKLTINQ